MLMRRQSISNADIQKKEGHSTPSVPFEFGDGEHDPENRWGIYWNKFSPLQVKITYVDVAFACLLIHPDLATWYLESSVSSVHYENKVNHYEWESQKERIYFWE